MSEIDRDKLEQVAGLAERMLLGELDAENHARLERMILDDPAAAQALLTYVQQAGAMREAFATQGKADDVREGLLDEQVLEAFEQLQAAADSSGALNVAEILAQQAKANRDAQPEDTGTRSAADLAAVGGYLLRHTFTPQRLAYLAAAAALVLGVTLLIVFMAGPDEQPEQPGVVEAPLPEPTPAIPVVATLTAEHDAVWAQASVAPGSDLQAGQRLTLTAGFAEITTARGAVAILEAPASIELLDNNNAMRLHHGKLVGVVESSSAKGFTVRTPTASVVDHGTRFGVVHDGVTQAWVFEGRVAVSPRHGSTDIAPTVLHAGMGAAVDEQARRVVPADTVAEHFYRKWDAIAQMPRLTGEVRYAAEMPKSLYYGVYEREWITLFPERQGVNLEADLAVTIDTPGDHVELNTLLATLPAGTRVDSYIVHLDLPGEVEANSSRSAKITFDRPILAVISRSSQLAESDAVLGQEGVQYIKGNEVEKKFGGVRGMEQATSNREAIKISDDRRTITIDMILVGTSIDQARVVLEARKAAN